MIGEFNNASSFSPICDFGISG